MNTVPQTSRTFVLSAKAVHCAKLLKSPKLSPTFSPIERKLRCLESLWSLCQTRSEMKCNPTPVCSRAKDEPKGGGLEMTPVPLPAQSYGHRSNSAQPNRIPRAAPKAPLITSVRITSIMGRLSRSIGNGSCSLPMASIRNAGDKKGRSETTEKWSFPPIG